MFLPFSRAKNACFSARNWASFFRRSSSARFFDIAFFVNNPAAATRTTPPIMPALQSFIARFRCSLLSFEDTTDFVSVERPLLVFEFVFDELDVWSLLDEFVFTLVELPPELSPLFLGATAELSFEISPLYLGGEHLEHGLSPLSTASRSVSSMQDERR